MKEVLVYERIKSKGIGPLDSLFTDPLFSLQSPSSAGEKIETASELAEGFEKNERKNKATSLYRLACESKYLPLVYRLTSGYPGCQRLS